MKKIKMILIALCAVHFSLNAMAEFDYRGIKSGMTFSDVKELKGIKKSGWTGSLTINFNKFFGKGNKPPGLNNVFFQFTPKEHGEKLWRVTLKFKKIEGAKAFTEGGLIEEAAQELVFKILYPNAQIKEETESYKCGDYDFRCKATGNGIYGKRAWIYVMLIDEAIFTDAVQSVFDSTKDKY